MPVQAASSSDRHSRNEPTPPRVTKDSAMSLTFPHGPLSNRPSDTNYALYGPRHRLFFDDFPRRVRAFFGGRAIFDTTRGKLLHETGMLPQLYVLRADVRMDLLEKSDRSTHCPFKGDASYWSIRVGDHRTSEAAWTYAESADLPWLRDYVAFEWTCMEAWFDEDEEIQGHLRDPYHRVDVRESSRHIRITIDDVLIAETARLLVLSETGLPNRYYLAPEDVRAEYLVHSQTQSVCPYKGTASYKTIAVGTRRLEDAAWFYPDPFDGVLKISGCLSFLHEEVVVEIDGQRVTQRFAEE